jgi:2-keto-4-pentenoate hydratase/2-oxohepta-3-ene-1,7-dioic acid hydratase in catechol pathway
MRLLRFEREDEFGHAASNPDGTWRDVSALWPPGDAMISRSAMEDLRRSDLTSFPEIGECRIGACAGASGKVVCVGLNYVDHAAELGTPLPAEPMLFMKPGSSVTGAHEELRIPAGFSAVDWEVELGIVIGTRASGIEPAAAFDHIAGYCVVNDITDRAWSSRDPSQWVKGKSAEGFTSVGPWLVTADEAGNPDALDLWTDVNGIRYQAGNSCNMKFSVAEIVSYVSRFMTLVPGDVISSGTPAGVGSQQKPPRFLNPGDIVETGIAGLGTQTRRVV